ncbi:MAG: histidine phosphatase family protein [Clostridia bacterium]|nr:histidine phosphatase family protein [Clostridia bacterium]
MKTTLIFVRHGQSKYNHSRKFTGQQDVPLTALGHDQAERTAVYLDRFPITRIYSSDLMRAMQTAEPTAARHGLPVIPKPQLRELYGGDWDGMPFDRLTKDYPELYRVLKTDVGNLHCPNGESTEELARRVSACVEEIVRENVGGCIAVFSHATPLRAMGCVWNGLPITRANELPKTANASVTVVEYDDDLHPTVLQYAGDEHLEGEITMLPVNV